MKLSFYAGWKPVVGETIYNVDNPAHTAVVLTKPRKAPRRAWFNLRVRDHTGSYDTITPCWMPASELNKS